MTTTINLPKEHFEGDLRAFSANLRLLCERTGSISMVCRKIDINRQQFNRYLSGEHAPSPTNLRRIAGFFNLSVSILFSDPEEFRTLLDGNFFHVIDELRHSKEMQGFIETVVLGSEGDNSKLLGIYDRYQYSSIYGGSILRSAFCIYSNGKFTQHYYVERFPSYDNPNKFEHIFRYHGFIFSINDRIFSLDFETRQKNEMTFGNFALVQRQATKFMFGVTNGIAATMFRQPYSTKVALHRRGPGLLKRGDLERCTVLSPNDASIPKEILTFLGDGRDMIHIR